MQAFLFLVCVWGNVFHRILAGGSAYITKKDFVIKQTGEMVRFR